MMLTTLKRPIKRRIGNLVVQLSESGITIRGYRRHKGRDYTWEQVASLAIDDLPLVRAAEQAAGTAVLAEVCGRGSVPTLLNSTNQEVL